MFHYLVLITNPQNTAEIKTLHENISIHHCFGAMSLVPGNIKILNLRTIYW